MFLKQIKQDSTEQLTFLNIYKLFSSVITFFKRRKRKRERERERECLSDRQTDQIADSLKINFKKSFDPRPHLLFFRDFTQKSTKMRE